MFHIWERRYLAPGDVETMSAGEREELMRVEDELARTRAEEEREFQARQEEQRLAREQAERLKNKQEEASRVARLEEMELAGAEEAAGQATVMDVDNTLSDMYAALGVGTGFVPPAKDAETARPE
jgi:hypothetical protein